MPIMRRVGDLGIGAGSGGRVTPISNLGTSPRPLVGPNPHREFIQFANPGSVTIHIAMERDADGNPPRAEPLGIGGTFAVFAGGVATLMASANSGGTGSRRADQTIRSRSSRAISDDVVTSLARRFPLSGRRESEGL